MNFTLTEEQEAVRDLAQRVFEGEATVERVEAVEASADRVDRALWATLADAGLLGVALPADVGGSGLGLVELCLVLEQQGRRVAPVPLLPTVVCAMAIGELGTAEQRKAWLPGVVAGEVVLTAAIEEAIGAAVVERDGRLSGRCVNVAAAHVAARVLVPTADGLWLVDPVGPGATVERAECTNRSLVGQLELDGAPGERVGGVAGAEWLRQRWLVAQCAIQVGVAEEAVRLAAAYTSQRHQFGKPLSTFQGVALKAADAYIDTEAIRVTMLQAAWRLDSGREAAGAVLVAKWWASEGGQRVVHITQHLHGGTGADVSYPVHRYFLWGKQLELALGGATETLARLGQVIQKEVSSGGGARD